MKKRNRYYLVLILFLCACILGGIFFIRQIKIGNSFEEILRCKPDAIEQVQPKLDAFTKADIEYRMEKVIDPVTGETFEIVLIKNKDVYEAVNYLDRIVVNVKDNLN